VRFIPNPDFEIDVEKLAEAAAEAVPLAKSYAPVRSGAYRDSIKAVVAGKFAYLVATDFKAHWIEFGSVHNPAHAPLRRGAQAAGLRVIESPKS
jgi:hypothetical protein